MKNLLQHIRIGYWLKCYFNSPKISIGLLLISLLMNVLYIGITNEIFFPFFIFIMLNIVFCTLSALDNLSLFITKNFITGLLQLFLSGISFIFIAMMALLS